MNHDCKAAFKNIFKTLVTKILGVSWCNYYRRKKWTWLESRVRIPNEAVCILHSANAHRKGVNHTIFLLLCVNCGTDLA